MKIVFLVSVLIAACCAVTVAQNASPRRNGASDRDSFSENYGVLIERNIFLRNRERPPARPAEAERDTAPAALSPEQSLMLTGIVFEEGQIRAYFENVQGASFVRASPGDPIARGRITEIRLNAVRYEADEQVTWIEIGQDLTGAVAAVAAPSAPAATNGPAAGELPEGVDPATLSAEERLRLRRRMEQQSIGANGVRNGQ